MNATALIAEDEGPQRRALARLLAVAWPELQIIAQCTDGSSAVTALENLRPSVAFLDIRMAGRNGLEVAEVASAGTQIVFTTAYDEHAVQAFELGAIDYILKPVTAERLQSTVQRLRLRLEQMREAAIRGEASESPAAKRLSWITATAGHAMKIIPIHSVLFFQARDSSTRVMSTQGEAIIRIPLYELLQRLDPEAFWQVHRSAIVQVSAIKSVRRTELGKLEIALHGSEEVIPVSQSFQHRFRGM